MDKVAQQALLRFGEHMFEFRDFDTTQITISCDFPMLKAVDIRPDNLISDKEARRLAKLGVETENTAVHFFLPDGRLNTVENTIWTGMTAYHAPSGVWEDVSRFKGRDATRQYRLKCSKRYSEYLEVLRRYQAVCSADFSMYSNWSDPTNVFNAQRNRMIGHVFQKEGLNVIPTRSWSGKRTYQYAFLGVEPGGTYAISCIGCNDNNKYRREKSLDDYRDAVKCITEKLSPIRLLVYGSGIVPDADYGNAEVLPFQNQETVRGNEAKAKKRRSKNGEEKA